MIRYGTKICEISRDSSVIIFGKEYFSVSPGLFLNVDRCRTASHGSSVNCVACSISSLAEKPETGC